MALTEDPTNSRFQHHVSFDNFAGGEPTEKNTISFTLNVKHKGYQFKRRSRTFMVGIDENDYSDIALQWMLEELVDDGDEIICLRVVDKDAKVVSDRNVERRQYQKEAKELMQRIQDRNDDNRAISIVLEFAVGKVHATFQKMVSFLILGEKGVFWALLICGVCRFKSTNPQCLSSVREVEVSVVSKGSSAIETRSPSGVYNILRCQLWLYGLPKRD
jgi:Universal stress protein family